MTPSELRALLFLALVAVVGAGARLARAPAAPVVEPAARRALAAQMAAVDSARKLEEAGKGRRAGRKYGTASRQSGDRSASNRRRAAAAPPPPPPDFPIDLDRADSAALDALPGIGPALAGRILADRAKCGPFGSLRELERVRGIGPALSKRLAPLVTFSLPPRPSDAVPGCGADPPSRSSARRARGSVRART
jgi:competence protein ComEA